jgi:hypothetical protein
VSDNPWAYVMAIPMLLISLVFLFAHTWTNGGKGSRGHVAGLVIKWFVLGSIGLSILNSCSR